MINDRIWKEKYLLFKRIRNDLNVALLSAFDNDIITVVTGEGFKGIEWRNGIWN